MATHRITTPAVGHTGMVGNVSFADGVAEIDADAYPAEMAYFQAAGYGVEDLDGADQTKTTRGRRAAKSDEEPAK